MKIISILRLSGRRSFALIFSLLMMAALSSCKAKANDEEEVAAKMPIGTKVSLTLVGYNYTSRYIDIFSVDGVGGGNLFVSDGTLGGGKSACCVSYRIGAGAWKAVVRWQTDACRFDTYTDSDGKHYEIHSFFKEVEVQIEPRIPDRPGYFEVHFFPDGHVEAAITENQSPSRLILSKDREDRSHYPRCPNGKKPVE